DNLRHDFAILMTDFDVQQLHLPINMMDNNRRGSTVIVDGQEVFYDVGTRMRGSMFTRQGRDRTGYNLAFHPDKMFRGVHQSVALDQNGINEIFVKFSSLQSGSLGGTYDDVLNVQTPSGAGGGPILAYLSRHTEMFQREQFENGEEGTLFKFEGIRVLTSTSDGRDPESLKLYQPIGWVPAFDIQDLGDDKELYRWPFLINRNRAKDDYEPIIQMAKAFSLQGDELEERVGELLDMDVWAHTFGLMSLLGIGDAYSQGNPHNLNMYVRPSDGKVLAFPWDWDFVYSQAPTAPLHGTKNIGRILSIPRYERLQMGHMNEIIKSTLNADYMSRWTEHYGTLIGSSLVGVQRSMEARSANILSRLPEPIPFQTSVNPPIVTTDIFTTVDSDASYFLPTAENGAADLGTRWTGLDFVEDENWSSGKAAIGFSSGAFDDYIKTSIPEMRNVSAGAYIRIPFELPAIIPSLDTLKLELNYDDGFVAYLNGVEVGRSNTPDSVDWESGATVSRRNTEAETPSTFDFGEVAHLLKPGKNVFAIHGMNRSASGNDFMIAPMLFGESVEVRETPDIVVEDSTYAISGRAWIDIHHLQLRGQDEALKVKWNDTTEWSAELNLRPGRNEFVLEAVDFNGNVVSSEPINIVSNVQIDADLNDDGIVNVVDVDLLAAAIRGQESIADLNRDSVANVRDLHFLIEDVLGTTMGDANLDGRFDSSDLVQIFEANEYEDGQPGNSTWAEGDFDGDGDFTTRDFVTAFMSGAYQGGEIGAKMKARDGVSAFAATRDLLFADDSRDWLD
ncbi:MAG: hypothetical protein KDB27_27440, partial [Planctomycetales bacterium]|nr:hypothetical protein [Planctomycetales bacterium]